jgi:AraC-like DNA-binding protein
LVMNKDFLKEKRVHGDAVFPLSIYSLTYNRTETIIDCHWHDEWEFILLTEGRAVFQIDTECFVVEKGQAVFVGSGQIHTGHAQAETCGFCAIVFNPNLLGSSTFDAVQYKFLAPFIQHQYQPPVHIQNTSPRGREILERLAEIIDNYEHNSLTYELVTKGNLYLILAAMIAGSSVPNPSTPPDNYKTEKLKQVIHYIQQNYDQKIAVRDLAGLVHMSEGYFYRFFRQLTRQTPIDYINYYRMQKAAGLLKSCDQKIAEIAMDVGFDNFSYFSALFKRYMQQTPWEYRTNSRKESMV